ncbi:MAG TPA: DUF2911 domain-containing protein [Blastocatellia bacterium]|nr:DUF2911 domain-containing protein [Blastocatellia bacterium]
MKLNRLIPTMLVLCLAATAFAQGGNRGTAEATINGKKVSINYGRPELKGRDLLKLAPAGMVWRVGMNQATEIETAGDLKVGDTTLKAGKYSLWVKKVDDSNWVLAFHPKTGVWGAPALKEGYVAELPLKLQTASDSADVLTIGLNGQGNTGTVNIHWGTSLLTGSFSVM